MSKTNYKYYLANGSCIEYALSPDSSLVDVIEDIVSSYYLASGNSLLDVVWVKPEIASALNIEACQRRFLFTEILNPPGMEVFKLQTFTGLVTIIAIRNMEFPVFLGSEQDLEDNNFNASMEEILCM